MTRHDPLVQTAAAPPRGPTGWFVRGITANMIIRAKLIDTVVAEAQILPGRHPPDGCSTPNAAARRTTSVTHKRKTA